MKKIYEDQEVVVISDKQPTSEGPFFTFSDGSSLNVNTREVINKGSGEIIIRERPMWPLMNDIIKEQRRFRPIKNIHIEGGMNNVVILPSDDTGCQVSIGGANVFVQECDISECGDTLYINTPKNEKRMYISNGSVWIDGRREPPKLDDDFGYIEVRCGHLQNLNVDAWGVGNIIVDVHVGTLSARINGGSTIDAMHVVDASVDISGSGNIAVTEMYGDLYGRVSGSGNIDILNGYVTHADVHMSGSGNLIVGALIQTADLSHSGSGNMLLAHVLEAYTARKCGSGMVRIVKSGID